MKLSKKYRLIQAIKGSNHVCETYNSITNSSSRFQIIGKKGKMLFPCIYIKPDDDIKKSFKATVTDMRYFARSTFSRSLVHKKKFWCDMTNSLQVRVLILSKKGGYFF